MNTIDGLKIHVPAEELRELLLSRVSHYSELADTSEKDMEGSILAQRHRTGAAIFKFRADHLVEGATYVLEGQDLLTLEIGQ